eukprot:scaffold77623_cov39-Phaeocystis_antarctica.AAC.1
MEDRLAAAPEARPSPQRPAHRSRLLAQGCLPRAAPLGAGGSALTAWLPRRSADEEAAAALWCLLTATDARRLWGVVVRVAAEDRGEG